MRDDIKMAQIHDAISRNLPPGATDVTLLLAKQYKK